MENFTLEIGANGIAVATLNVPGRSTNTINRSVQRDLDSLIEAIRDDRIVGTIIRSGKTSGFCDDMDREEMQPSVAKWQAARSQDDLRAALAEASELSSRIRSLETNGKPVVAIINGAALGAGLELALGCHRRIGVASDNLRLALPEATLGLMPAAGGTQRLLRIAGLTGALPHLLDGAPISPEDALKLGVIHELSSPEQAMETARNWISGGASSAAPWDEKGFRIPGGGPHGPAGFAFGPAIAARRGAPKVSDACILKALYEGAQVPIDAGLRIESRHFLHMARNLAATSSPCAV